MSSWWQKKLLRYGLRYALARTGLLDETVLDLDSLDISIGRQNVVELKDVGLNIKQISTLTQLPPGLRLETARVLSLRLTIPADFYQSSIVIEVDGIDLVLHIQGDDANANKSQPNPGRRNRSPTSTRRPQHRKTSRRIPSPPPYDPGSVADSDDESLHIPTAQEVARSFLREEPIQERRELEASVAATAANIEESIVSESSEGADVGTGTGVGVPGFLTGFLQGIVDRFRLQVKNVELRVETALREDGTNSIPLALKIRVGSAGVNSADLGTNRMRTVTLQDISVALLSEDTVLADSSELPSGAASSDQLHIPHVSRGADGDPNNSKSMGDLHNSARSAAPDSPSLASMQSTLPEPMPQPLSPQSQASAANLDTDEFTDAVEQRSQREVLQSAELEIRPGDDNISWGSRRSQTSGPAEEDLWQSMVSEDELPESLILEPERAPTPRAYSSRSTSPLAFRQRRPVSPYDRGLGSPGSWPIVGHSAYHNVDTDLLRSQSGLAHSQYSDVHQSDHALDVLYDTTDNKRNALEQAYEAQAIPKTPPEPEGPIDDSMLESRMFSHEDAESIYMSAYSASPNLPMPGGWGSGTPSPDRPDKHSLHQMSSLDGMMASVEQPSDLSGHATPRAETPVGQPSRTLPRASWVAKELIHIDYLNVSLPSANDGDAENAALVTPPTPQTQSRAGGLPGTFSAYSEMSNSRLRGIESVYSEQGSVHLAPRRENSSIGSPQIDVTVGTVKAHLDVSSGRLLYSLSSNVVSALNNAEKQPAEKNAEVEADSIGSSTPNRLFSAHVDRVGISLRAHITTNSEEPPAEPDIFSIRCSGIGLKSGADKSLRMQSFVVLLGGEDFLWLENDSEDLSTSQKIGPDVPVLAVNVTQRHTSNRRPVTELAVQTACLRLRTDLTVVEDTFGSFGGLSGVLELSNSILSDCGSGTPSAQKPTKGVRFVGEGDLDYAKPEIKFNGRFAGIVASLHGPHCSVQLRTTTMKAVYREQGVIATIEHISLIGPCVPDTKRSAAVSADLTSLRVEYLLTPQDKDLERLLSLLTPSKDRYDNDDDILIETLLRQRRKGSLLRTVLGGAKVKIDEWESLTLLTELGDNLAKLSAVTKYLPEDDRPGLLSLIRMGTIEARIPVNERFGRLRLAAQDVHLAHIGIPPLLAFSIGGVHASRSDDQTPLLHAFLPLEGSESSPAVMSRMLGDEEEPTIKVKLFNLCAEYSVPVILALTNLDQLQTPEDLVDALAQSVTNVAMKYHVPQLQRSPESDMSRTTSKRTTVDILIHESAIGLKPRQLSSKALIVLSDVHVSTKMPPQAITSAKVELRKTSFFLTDGGTSGEDDHMPQRTSSNEDRVGLALLQQGYVSIGTLFAATVGITAKDDTESPSKMIEVDVKNELFLLETCADSTCTLLATLGDLAPPTPPNTDPKYLLEPETIEDVINSFSGEEVPGPQTQLPPQLLFDAEQAERDYDDTVSEMPLDASVDRSLLGEEVDELLAESAMAGSLYGPVSGMFGVGEDGDDQNTIGEDYPETAESLLEDDPFEMTIAPDERLGDTALMKDLARQCKPAANDTPIDLGLYEIEELGHGQASKVPQALGAAHRFSASYVSARHSPKSKQLQDLPFRLHVGDFSLIWHLHDGYDWQRTREEVTHAVERVEQKAEERRARRRVSRLEQDEEESVIGDFLFNSVYIGVPTSQDAQDLRRQINRYIDEDVSETVSIPVSGMSRPTTHSASGQPRPRQHRRLKVGRSKSHKISFDLRSISADVMVYPPGTGELINSVDLRLKEFEIYDRVPTSTWRKFLTSMTSDPAGREMAKPIIHIQLDSVKTLQSHTASEFLLHVAVLPLRLHVDQDALDFITRFFEFKDERMALPERPDSEKPFIQRIEVETVDLCLDYKPKTLDYAGLRSGKTTEFMNIITLEGANIRLKHLIHYGISGFDKLHPVLNDLWMSEVKRTQLPTILAGLAPVRSLVNLGSGVKDVVAIPLREYRKDGRIVRSIQKGAFHFGKTTTSELARLGAKVALGTQTLLTNAEELLSPSGVAGPSRQGVDRRVSGEDWTDVVHDQEAERRPAVSAYANQPLGLLSGLKSARRYLEHDLLTAKDALIAVQGEFLESRGPGDLASAVARHAPTVILRPVIGATRAVGTTLLGVGNQIDRGYLRHVDDKYKRR